MFKSVDNANCPTYNQIEATSREVSITGFLIERPDRGLGSSISATPG